MRFILRSSFGIVSLLLVLVHGVCAESTELLYSTKSKSIEIKLLSDPSKAEFLIEGELAKTSVVFEVDSPRRVVVDIFYSKEKLEKRSNKAIPLIKAIRVGTHKDKIRFVIEPSSDTRLALVPDGEKKRVSIVAKVPNPQISPTLVPTIVPTITHTIAPTVLPTIAPSVSITTPTIMTVTPSSTSSQSPTMTADSAPTNNAPALKVESSVTPTLAPSPTPSATLTPTFTETPIPSLTPTATFTTQPTLTPTVAQKLTVATAPPTEVVLLGKSMLGFEFRLQGGESIIELKLTERSQFRLVKERERRFKLTIPGIQSIPSGLNLPNFPPNEVLGFTVIQALQSDAGVDILIGVEDGKKAVAVNQDNSIIVTAVPAGF